MHGSIGLTGLLEDASRVLLPRSLPLLRATTTPLSRFPLSRDATRMKAQVIQTSADGKHGYALMHSVGNKVASQPVGMSSICMPASGVSDVPRSLVSVLKLKVFTNGTDHFVLRNANVQLTISEGRISSLIDVRLGRELIPKGSSGGLVIFEDRPNYWDARDVEIHHLETATPLSFSQVRVIAEGPLRAAVQTQAKYGNSTIDVTVRI
ncbi:glycoside hydrolase family 38 protein [Suillus luteus UH-Slu-Lm8-n1]|uniref:Glycoside hydrolase family 38 protein n=1 Tax=Suillus luteus UH-Slu-Lm8-n1 TaxID=930992 RepID=A0A0C9ZBU4_9AGAM|nr:glycoside hydrolase family 38 protein [Suillus luteus UH-Slu-Lm8-n1]